MADTHAGRPVAPDDWVPVERRWWGLDRRTLLPGLVVFAIAILLRTVIPLIDQAVPGHDVIRAGDRINLGDGLTVAPPAGWELSSGILVGANTVQPGAGSPSATLIKGGVGVQVEAASFAGDAGALLDQVNRTDSETNARPAFAAGGDRAAVTAAGGITGLAESYTSTSVDGIIAAYTFPDGRGLTIEATGASDQLAARTGQIDAMLRSVSLAAQR